MSALAWAAFAALAICVAVLCTPWRVSARYASEAGHRFTLRVGLFGGIAPDIKIVDAAARGRGRRQPAPRARKSESKARRGRGGSLLRGSRAASALPRLLRDVLGVVRIEALVGEVEFGLSDPAATGEVYGALASLLFALPQSDQRRVTVRPVFHRRRLAGTLDARLSLTPAALAPPAVVFAWRVFGPRGR